MNKKSHIEILRSKFPDSGSWARFESNGPLKYVLEAMQDCLEQEPKVTVIKAGKKPKKSLYCHVEFIYGDDKLIVVNNGTPSFKLFLNDKPYYCNGDKIIAVDPSERFGWGTNPVTGEEYQQLLINFNKERNKNHDPDEIYANLDFEFYYTDELRRDAVKKYFDGYDVKFKEQNDYEK